MSWREDAFQSTTARRATAVDFANGGASRNGGLLMRLSVPAGVGGVAMSKAGFESELLLDRGHTLTVVADHGLVDGVRTVDVQVQPAGGAV